jgi:hypothetical protein
MKLIPDSELVVFGFLTVKVTDEVPPKAMAGGVKNFEMTAGPKIGTATRAYTPCWKASPTNEAAANATPPGLTRSVL